MYEINQMKQCGPCESKAGIILGMGSINERRLYYMTISLTGQAHIYGMGSANERRFHIVKPAHDTRNDPWKG